jgi:hypothetical protein
VPILANNKIIVKRTSTAGRTPNTTAPANLQYIAAGELALNMVDKTFFTSNGTNLIYVGSNVDTLTVTNSGSAIKLTNTTSGWVSFPTGSGYGPPTNTTSSIGTKLLLYPGVTATQSDFAIGIESFGMWHSVPINTATYQFKWYANTTQLMSLNGVGALSVNGSVNASSLSLSTNTATIGTGSYFVSNGNVGVGTNAPSYKLQVNGSFAATTKSFIINHPIKNGFKLRYGSLEGPENGVYVRGRITSSVITLPDYWEGLVDSDTITVSLTPIGKSIMPSVLTYDNKKVVLDVSNDITVDCFYHVFGERKDVDKLVVEF